MDDRKIEDVYVIVSEGRVTSVRFSYSVAVAEAAQKRGKIRPAKLVWKDVDAPRPDQSVGVDTAKEFEA